jgi:hypothetical protein
MTVTMLERRSGRRPRARRAARAVVAALFSAAFLLAGAGGGGAPIRAADAPSIVILLDGLCSELPSGASVTANFSGAGGLVERLTAAGWVNGAIAGFSYRGGNVDGAGGWQPLPYSCADSRDQSLAADDDLLKAQIAALAVAHPGARFHLVGFSLGGLVAFAYLATLGGPDGAALPAGTTLGSVSTLDSPLGGAPFVSLLCSLAPDVCGGTTVAAAGSALHDMSAIWDSASGYPAGATRSVASRVGDGIASNQAVAAAAAARGTTLLTIGNLRDWMFAPVGAGAGTLTFLDSQWLTTDPRGAGVHARAITSGPASCPAEGGSVAAAYGCNHPLVTRDEAVGGAILAAMAGRAPALATMCAAGAGGCLALPPRPAMALKSTIAAGIVSGGGRFGTSAVTVRIGGRATILFTTSPARPGATLEIWGRSAKGQFRFMTTRVADRRGIVRYYTPPITGWAAIQARYRGDYVSGPGVSPARVVTIRR